MTGVQSVLFRSAGPDFLAHEIDVRLFLENVEEFKILHHADGIRPVEHPAEWTRT